MLVSVTSAWIYVGGAKGSLDKRISEHGVQISNGGNKLLYKHFNLPTNLPANGVRILENIPTYKQSNFEKITG